MSRYSRESLSQSRNSSPSGTKSLSFISLRDGSKRAAMRATAGVKTFSAAHSRSRREKLPSRLTICAAANSAGASHPRSASRIASGSNTARRNDSSGVRLRKSSGRRGMAPIRCDWTTACMPEYMRYASEKSGIASPVHHARNSARAASSFSLRTSTKRPNRRIQRMPLSTRSRIASHSERRSANCS